MNEKLILDILSQGCPSKKEAAMVKQIYMELCEVKRYWDVEYFLDKTKKKMYLSAKIRKTEKPSLFVPVHDSESLNFIQMQEFIEFNKEENYEGVYLAIINPDSTCVYYQISNGLNKPKEITSRHLTKNKKEMLDLNLRKHKDILHQSALYGIPITLTNEIKKVNPSCSKNEEI